MRVARRLRFIAAWAALATGVVACGGQAKVEGEGSSDPGASECADPKPVLQKDTELESGFMRCSDGFVHRVGSAVCASPATPGNCTVGGGSCETDAECTAKPYGACMKGPLYNPICGCSYGCASDADCSAGDVCACAGVVDGRARCIKNDCDGCGGGLCGLSVTFGSCGEVWTDLVCHGPKAECRVDADCASEPTTYCTGDPETPLACKFIQEWVCTAPDNCQPCG